MKSTIKIDYTKHYDPINGKYYVGWASDYTAVVVQAKSKKKLKKKILKSLKVLFLHFISEIDKGNIKTELSEHETIIPIAVAVQPCKGHMYSKSVDEPRPRLCLHCNEPEACNGEGEFHICGKEELSTGERWDLLKNSHSGKHTIPWDRMALPSHEWFDNYTTIYNTKISIKIPRYRDELTSEEIKHLELIEEYKKDE